MAYTTHKYKFLVAIGGTHRKLDVKFSISIQSIRDGGATLIEFIRTKWYQLLTRIT